MGVHRHNHNSVELGVHDRPAGGQRVGGRSGRRRDDQAVGLLAADELAVDVQLELDHPRRFAGVQHHVVQRIALANGLGVAADFGLQQEAVFHQIVAVEYFGDFDFQFIGANIGQETEAATVDAEHRNIVSGQCACGAKQAAVTADHNHHVTDFTEHLAR
ncbi:hypothetical protein D3C84_871610 [compost metagenome]